MNRVTHDETHARSTGSPTIGVTTGMLAPSARTPSWPRLSHPTPSVQSPGATLLPIRYVCLTCSDTDVQILGWGRTCWMCGTARIAPATTIASTQPGTSATELLTRWRHLIR